MSPRRASLGAAAFLAGAAGLGLEDVLLQTCGLALGQVRASALGLGVFVAGWALGARFAGGARARLRGALPLAGLAVLAAAALAPPVLLRVGASSRGGGLAGAAALGVVLLAALPQGAFLPWLVRAQADDRAGIGGLWAANLLGSVLGVFVLGYLAVGALGRPRAALLAGLVGLAAGALGGLGVRSAAPPIAVAAGGSGAATGRRGAGLAVGLATLWIVGLEWVGLRLGALWVGSEQLALTAVLAASLAALGLGAVLVPRCVHRDGRGPVEVLAAAAVLATWPLFAAPALAGLQSSSLGPWLVQATGWRRALEPLTAAVLVGPTVFALGGLVPAVWRACAGEGGRRLGGLLLHEAWGALLAGPLVHLALVPRVGLGGTIGVLTLAGAGGVLALRRGAPRSAAVLAPALVAVGAAACLAPEPALSSPKLVDPALRIRAFAEDAQFAVSVVDDGVIGERTLLTDRFRAAGSGRDYRYMRALGQLPLLLHPAPRRVAVLALGTGTTVGAVSLHPADEVRTIDVFEISPAVVDQASWFTEVNRGALEPQREPRVHVVVGDGRRELAARPGRYDVVTMEPLLPDSPFGVYLYTREFYELARRSLAAGGLLCQWVPPHALEPPVFDAVVAAFCGSFEWSGVWLVGSQVILVGGGRAPQLSAARFSAGASSADDELAAALRDLGLDSPAAVAARHLVDGAAWPAVGRPLTDADPWIAYRDKATGTAALGWMPQNLERLIALAVEEPADAPAAWRDAAAPGAAERFAALRALPAARAAVARGELDLVTGVRVPGEIAAAVDAALAPLRAGAGDDPEVRALVEQVEFLRALRRGVSLLASGGAQAAAEDLVRAAELRPERADAHVYLATALSRLGLEAGARAAAAEAVRRCPRIAETPAGVRALALGLDPRLLSRAPAATGG